MLDCKFVRAIPERDGRRPPVAEARAEAALFAVKNITAGHGQMTIEHQLVFDGVLDSLDLHLLAADGAAQDPFDHYVRALPDRVRQRLGQNLVAAQPLDGPKGALNGQVNAGFVELLMAAIPFANDKALPLEGVDPVQMQLVWLLFDHGTALRLVVL